MMGGLKLFYIIHTPPFFCVYLYIANVVLRDVALYTDRIEVVLLSECRNSFTAHA
jgi:hypothetical protein